jgi:hypothetical protein
MSRTTLSLDDDVLETARAIADRDRRTIGEVVSDLARRGIVSGRGQIRRTRNGLHLLPSRGKPSSVTLQLVNRLRDEMP